MPAFFSIFGDGKPIDLYIDGVKVIKIKRDRNIFSRSNIYCFYFENNLVIPINIDDYLIPINDPPELERVIIEKLTTTFRRECQEIASEALNSGFLTYRMRNQLEEDILYDDEMNGDLDPDNSLDRFEDILKEK